MTANNMAGDYDMTVATTVATTSNSASYYWPQPWQQWPYVNPWEYPYFIPPVPPTQITISYPGRDPRCPQCGRAVIGDGVQGLEGVYHEACTKPPGEGVDD